MVLYLSAINIIAAGIISDPELYIGYPGERRVL
jgi:hypothetical protein